MTESDEPRTYWKPERLPREWAIKAFESKDADAIGRALVRLTYHDPDWKWVYEWCLAFVEHPDPTVRMNAATCIGLLAYFHKPQELLAAVPILAAMSEDSDQLVAGCASDAKKDIELHLGKVRRMK
jgi:hypothetical protein